MFYFTRKKNSPTQINRDFLPLTAWRPCLGILINELCYPFFPYIHVLHKGRAHKTVLLMNNTTAIKKKPEPQKPKPKNQIGIIIF